MPKIKDIQTGANSLNFYSQSLADFLSQISSTALCASIDYEPQTTQDVPQPRTIKLAILKLDTNVLANQKATIAAFAKKNNIGQILISEKDSVLLIGEFGDKEIEFAKIYELQKNTFAQIETVEQDAEIIEKDSPKSKRKKDIEA